MPQQYAVGYKNVTANDQFFNGHFPERAIMPGVLQIEAMAQLGGIAMLDPSDEAAKNQFFFGGIEGCRFRKPVVPGDTLVRGLFLLLRACCRGRDRLRPPTPPPTPTAPTLCTGLMFPLRPARQSIVHMHQHMPSITQSPHHINHQYKR